MKTIVINGDFYDLNVTGVQRYATEIIRQLDVIYDKSKINMELLIPSDLKKIPLLKNIKIVRYKKKKRLLWQQIHLMNYCKKKKAYCLCLCSNAPFFYSKNTIEVVHDAATIVHPEFYSKKYIIMNKFLLWSRINKFKKIITVSQFSKNEIAKYCKINKETIVVAPNAWQHMNNICEESVFDKYPQINKENYYYTLSSLSPNKNFKWILNVAKNNPKSQFVISGMKIDLFSDEQIDKKPSNVFFTGYLSDGEMKTLLHNARAFLFPTLYEGFGIPPLEALTLKRKIVVSDTECMHEIYEDSAIYINPYKYDYNIKDLLKKNLNAENVLNKYSWFKSAQIIYEELLLLDEV